MMTEQKWIDIVMAFLNSNDPELEIGHTLIVKPGIREAVVWGTMVPDEAGETTHIQVVLWVRSINTSTFEVPITVPFLDALRAHARQGPNPTFAEDILWRGGLWKIKCRPKSSTDSEPSTWTGSSLSSEG